jgi:dipeptidyl aminopeptidase/acylaminoacyl peptidase
MPPFARRHRFRSGSLAGLLVLVAACGEANGLSDTNVGFHSLGLAASRLDVWRYAGRAGRRISPDSLPFVLDFAEAPGGRMAYVTFDPDVQRLTIAEYGSSGGSLRVVYVGPVNPPDGSSPRFIEYSPDGARLAWVTGPGAQDSLFVLDPGATTPRGLASRPRFAGGSTLDPVTAPPVRWSPRGDIVFGPPGALVGIDAVTGATRPIASDLGQVYDYDFASDGRLAVSSRQPGTNGWHLLAQRTAGAPLEEIAPGNGNAAMARWSRDGSRIATVAPDTVYDGTNGGTTEGSILINPVLGIVRIDGGPAVTNGSVGVAGILGWSRDGRVLVRGLELDGSGNLPASGYADVLLVPARGAAINLTQTANVDERVAKRRP